MHKCVYHLNGNNTDHVHMCILTEDQWLHESVYPTEVRHRNRLSNAEKRSKQGDENDCPMYVARENNRQ